MCSRLERIQREFLWGRGNLEKKPHWATMCKTKKKCGLGVRSLYKLNNTLLCSYANERASFWRNVISSEFGVNVGGWSFGDIRGGFDNSLWKEMRKYWTTFLPNLVFSLGDGRRVSFWNDVWCGGEAFCNAFPTLLI